MLLFGTARPAGRFFYIGRGGIASGRFRCQNPDMRRQIPVTYFLSGIAAAVISGALVMAWLPPARWAEGAGLAAVLVALALIDIRTFRLPDWLTLPLIGAGLILAGFRLEGFPLQGAIGAIAGYGVMWTIARLYQRTRGMPGLGLGDAKLAAGAGTWLGWAGLPFVLLIASLAGILAFLVMAFLQKRLDPARPVPFGPFLALGFFLVWFWQAAQPGGLSPLL